MRGRIINLLLFQFTAERTLHLIVKCHLFSHLFLSSIPERYDLKKRDNEQFVHLALHLNKNCRRENIF